MKTARRMTSLFIHFGRRQRFALIPAVLLLLSGCMYPNELRQENQVALKENVLIVQNAIDQYRTKTGVLPIKNSTMETPLYEKYPVDFKKLLDGKYISRIPPTAYENGGTAIFVLVHPDEKAEVKLMDLTPYLQANSVQHAVDAYQAAHSGEIPKGEAVAPRFYRLDFAKMNMPVEQVKSLYSLQLLGFLVHDSGEVLIDYAPEIARFIARKGITPDPGQDLRALLLEESLFVPVKSRPYYWKQGIPQISES